MQIGRDFFDRDPVEVARDLLGCHVVVGDVALRLTEVEAYRGQADPGSHAFRGETPRTAVMFGPPGHLYVYFSYGMHHCVNIVCGPERTAGAVLLRAGEVIAGRELVAARRRGIRERDWARGPGRLTAALGITLDDNGADACAGGRAHLLRPMGGRPSATVTGPRVGVSGPGGDAVAYPWRFWLADEPSVSAYRPGRASKRGQGA